MATGSVIGALRVNLGLDSANFTRGVRGVAAPLNKLKSQFLAVAGVASAVGGALSALTIATAKTAMEIKQFSQVANAAPEELQKWSVASKTVGIEQEKLSDILKDVNDRVGDFLTTGGGPMKDFFEQVAPKIGITADAFRDLSGPEALQLYVSSLERAGLSQQEMTFYLEAMASDATALIPLLKNGGAEMARLGQNAQSLGGIMKSSTVASLAALDLALADVATSIKGVGFRISGAMAPALTAMATGFANAMREGGLFRNVIDGLIESFDRIAAYMTAIVAFFGVRYVAAVIAARVATFSLVGSLVALRAAIAATGVGLLVIGAGELVLWLGRVVKASGSVGEAFKAVYEVGKASFTGVWKTAWGLSEILAGVASSIAAKFVQAFALIARSWDGLVDGMATAWNMIADTAFGETLGLGNMQDSDVSGRISAFADGLIDQAVTSINSGGDRIRAAGKDVADAISESVRFDEVETGVFDPAGKFLELEQAAAGDPSGGGSGGAAGAVKKVGDAAREAAEEVNKLGENTGFKSFIDDMARGLSQIRSFSDAWDAVKDAALRALQSISENLMRSGLSNLLGAGGLFGNLFAGFFDKGGSIPSGKFGIAGENGMELVRGPAHITSTRDTADIMSGGNMHITVGVSADNNGNLLPFVEGVTRRGVEMGMAQQNRELPGRVNAINAAGDTRLR